MLTSVHIAVYNRCFDCTMKLNDFQKNEIMRISSWFFDEKTIFIISFIRQSDTVDLRVKNKRNHLKVILEFKYHLYNIGRE